MAIVSDKTVKLLARGRVAAENFEEFCRFVLGINPAAHQRQWIKALQDIADNPDSRRKLLIIAPPGAGKTSLMVGFAAFMIGRRPNNHHGLISYSDRVAWGRSQAVRNLIERSIAYRATFPTVTPSRSNWGISEFQVERDNLADP